MTSKPRTKREEPAPMDTGNDLVITGNRTPRNSTRCFPLAKNRQLTECSVWSFGTPSLSYRRQLRLAEGAQLLAPE